MATNYELAFSWIFGIEVPATKDLEVMLVPGEEILGCYKSVRDIACLTNKRIIYRDKQGITGKKIETYSIPFRTIDMWSIENAGFMDLTAEVELWTKSGHFKINLTKGANIELFNKVLSQAILN